MKSFQFSRVTPNHFLPNLLKMNNEANPKPSLLGIAGLLDQVKTGVPSVPGTTTLEQRGIGPWFDQQPWLVAIWMQGPVFVDDVRLVEGQP